MNTRPASFRLLRSTGASLALGIALVTGFTHAADVPVSVHTEYTVDQAVITRVGGRLRTKDIRSIRVKKTCVTGRAVIWIIARIGRW